MGKVQKSKISEADKARAKEILGSFTNEGNWYISNSELHDKFPMVDYFLALKSIVDSGYVHTVVDDDNKGKVKGWALTLDGVEYVKNNIEGAKA